jgi:hypothetical protein
LRTVADGTRDATTETISNELTESETKMTTTKITIKARNNADARRMGAGQLDIPGADHTVHTGGKNVKCESFDHAKTIAWLDAAHEVDSYETAAD